MKRKFVDGEYWSIEKIIKRKEEEGVKVCVMM
jgi:hypothetical protein